MYQGEAPEGPRAKTDAAGHFFTATSDRAIIRATDLYGCVLEAQNRTRIMVI